MRLAGIFFVFSMWALAAEVGPSKGSLVVVGGGAVGPEISSRFLELAGGKDALIVVIPTADEKEPVPDAKPGFLVQAGATNIKVLHTRDRKVADSAEFVAALLKARAVWFDGGRQWRLVDAYLGTRTQQEIEHVLERGGVIGGSSAGATIQGSYLVRGARAGNALMMAPGYEKGFGYLKNVAVDQHIIRRHREKDLAEVVAKHPELLGIGIDEGTAIVVREDDFEVVGVSKVAVHQHGREFYFLSAGDRFDLRKRVTVLKGNRP